MTVVPSEKKSFNFAEIVIVVVILAVLSALIVPHFGKATVEPDLASLAATLQTVRTQLQHYKLQHKDTFPTLVDWQEQMLSKTKTNGSISARGTCGPYLLQIPVNPLDGFRKISPHQDASGGWTYDQTTGHFSSNDPSVLDPNSQSKDL